MQGLWGANVVVPECVLDAAGSVGNGREPHRSEFIPI